MKLVHVVSFTLFHDQAQRNALIHAQRLCMCSSEAACPVLLFCDLPDASCIRYPQEDSLIQTLHAGVKSIQAQHENSCFLLVRRRIWDDAARQYLGAGQSLSCREVIAQLMLQGESAADFELATLACASIKERWDAVLFSDISVICTPDTPARAAAYLQKHNLPAVSLPVLPCRERPLSALERLSRPVSFSLSAPHAAQEYALMLQEHRSADSPMLYTLKALSGIAQLHSIPAAQQCFFIRRYGPDWPSIISDYRRLCRIAPLSNAGIPLFQLFLLCAAAVWGIPLFAFCALLPELWALLHPRAWPGVVLRMALLPLTALHALDTLLCRLLARSSLLRLRVPGRLFSPLVCLFAALALLAAAFVSVYALVSVLPYVMLWLSIPVLYSALDQTDASAA